MGMGLFAKCEGSGYPPLVWACLHAFKFPAEATAAVRGLLAAGASAAARSRDGQTAVTCLVAAELQIWCAAAPVLLLKLCLDAYRLANMGVLVLASPAAYALPRGEGVFQPRRYIADRGEHRLCCCSRPLPERAPGRQARLGRRPGPRLPGGGVCGGARRGRRPLRSGERGHGRVHAPAPGSRRPARAARCAAALHAGAPPSAGAQGVKSRPQRADGSGRVRWLSASQRPCCSPWRTGRAAREQRGLASPATGSASAAAGRRR